MWAIRNIVVGQAGVRINSAVLFQCIFCATFVLSLQLSAAHTSFIYARQNAQLQPTSATLPEASPSSAAPAASSQSLGSDDSKYVLYSFIFRWTNVCSESLIQAWICLL